MNCLFPQVVGKVIGGTSDLVDTGTILWPTPNHTAPLDEPPCGFTGTGCPAPGIARAETLKTKSERFGRIWFPNRRPSRSTNSFNGKTTAKRTLTALNRSVRQRTKLIEQLVRYLQKNGVREIKNLEHLSRLAAVIANNWSMTASATTTRTVVLQNQMSFRTFRTISESELRKMEI